MSVGIPLSISAFSHTLMISVFWPNQLTTSTVRFIGLIGSATEIGLAINHNKAQAMHHGQASDRHVSFVNGDPVDSCDKFEYLGVTTSNTETVFVSRFLKAWAAVTKIRSIFNSKANGAIKIGLCRSAVESILLFELECLQLTSTFQDKLDAAYRRILRYALWLLFPDCISMQS